MMETIIVKVKMIKLDGTEELMNVIIDGSNDVTFEEPDDEEEE